jgi:integrase
VHSEGKRSSVTFAPPNNKSWQPPERLSPADVQTTIDAAANDRDRLLLPVLWATGGRSSEALALRACAIQRDALVPPNCKSPSQLGKKPFLHTDSLGTAGEVAPMEYAATPGG